MNKIKKRILQEIKEHFVYYEQVFSKNDRVLDIGTGLGLTANYIKSQINTLKITGLDVIAYEYYANNIQMIVYDGNLIPFSNKAFDISLLFYTLHHIKTPLNTLKEAVRVSKRSIIIVEEFELSNASHKEEMKKEEKILKAIGYSTKLYHNNMTEKLMEEMINSLNLKIQVKKKLQTRSPKLIEKYLYILQK